MKYTEMTNDPFFSLPCLPLGELFLKILMLGAILVVGGDGGLCARPRAVDHSFSGYAAAGGASEPLIRRGRVGLSARV